jgi:hypothetical protein
MLPPFGQTTPIVPLRPLAHHPGLPLTPATWQRNVQTAMSVVLDRPVAGSNARHRIAQALRGRRRVALVGVATALILVLTGAAAFLLTRDSTPKNTSTASVAAPPTQVKNLPPGATACPQLFRLGQAQYQRGASGTPMTSCAFVEQVRFAYSKQPRTPGPQQIRVVSPKTGQWYDLVCTPTGAYVTCTGGVVAVIYLYTG